MKLTSNSINDNRAISDEFALGAADLDEHIRFTGNRNPHLAWSNVPEGTKSLVLICVDVDVPGKPDDVNKEDREVPADLPRVDFYHWVMVDLAPQDGEIAAGSCSDGVTAHGKKNPSGPAGCRQGLNGYSDWFEGDEDMEGEYFGYDGPCPPWNDSIVHHYHFRLYATDIERLPVDGNFTGDEVMEQLEGHILAEASLVGLYSTNPRVEV